MALSMNAWQTLTWSVRPYCSCPVGYLREALSVAAQTNTKTDPLVGKHLKKVKTILFQNKTWPKTTTHGSRQTHRPGPHRRQREQTIDKPHTKFTSHLRPSFERFAKRVQVRFALPSGTRNRENNLADITAVRFDGGLRGA